jgi:hypothetical protein
MERSKPRTLGVRLATKTEQRIRDLLYPERSYWRPRSRRDCAKIARPCPYVACRHHLYLDVDPKTGGLKLNHPDLEPWELEPSCSLDIAEDHRRDQDSIGHILNITGSAIAIIEEKVLAKLRESAQHCSRHGHLEGVPSIAETLEDLAGRSTT